MSDPLGSPFAGPAEAVMPSVESLSDNAFFVLGLTPRARWPKVVEAAEALLTALEAGEPWSRSYDTPLGPRARTQRKVLRAMARLQDPDERIQHEIWWETPHRGAPPTAARDDAYPHASAAWGWRPR